MLGFVPSIGYLRGEDVRFSSLSAVLDALELSITVDKSSQNKVEQMIKKIIDAIDTSTDMYYRLILLVDEKASHEQLANINPRLSLSVYSAGDEYVFIEN